ncbi:hypothetical protein [Peribacillus asahii]|uniref:hypothetical protein n=1 Tax=Peribacillus asahii TaxID=228899 RepID=UPI0037F5FC61
MSELFVFDERLGIALPSLTQDWDEYEHDVQQQILLQWENIRGSIPDRIRDLESIINQKQDALSNENNFSRSCELNTEIAEMASIINDLWLWYRTNQHISSKRHT